MKGSTVLGVAALVLIVVALLNGISTEGPGSRGVPAGEPLPPFAAPLFDGPAADANVAVEADSGSAGALPACDVRGEEVFNVCELYERGPVALAFFATRSDRCMDQIDLLDALDAEGVQVAAVAIRGDQETLRRVVRERGWELPVAWDRDGAVANRYAVAVCPTITFAREGGEVVGTALSFLDAAALRERVAELGG